MTRRLLSGEPSLSLLSIFPYLSLYISLTHTHKGAAAIYRPGTNSIIIIRGQRGRGYNIYWEHPGVELGIRYIYGRHGTIRVFFSATASTPNYLPAYLPVRSWACRCVVFTELMGRCKFVVRRGARHCCLLRDSHRSRSGLYSSFSFLLSPPLTSDIWGGILERHAWERELVMRCQFAFMENLQKAGSWHVLE